MHGSISALTGYAKALFAATKKQQTKGNTALYVLFNYYLSANVARQIFLTSVSPHQSIIFSRAPLHHLPAHYNLMVFCNSYMHHPCFLGDMLPFISNRHYFIFRKVRLHSPAFELF